MRKQNLGGVQSQVSGIRLSVRKMSLAWTDWMIPAAFSIRGAREKKDGWILAGSVRTCNLMRWEWKREKTDDWNFLPVQPQDRAWYIIWLNPPYDSCGKGIPDNSHAQIIITLLGFRITWKGLASNSFWKSLFYKKSSKGNSGIGIKTPNRTTMSLQRNDFLDRNFSRGNWAHLGNEFFFDNSPRKRKIRKLFYEKWIPFQQ